MSFFLGLDEEIEASTRKELEAIAHASGVEVAIMHGLFHYMKKRFDALESALSDLAKLGVVNRGLIDLASKVDVIAAADQALTKDQTK